MKGTFPGGAGRSRIEAAALLAVVALLAVLAALQHRWLLAVAEAERRDLREAAAEKADAIARDVDRELTRAALELRLDAKAVAPGGGADFAARLDRWRGEAAYPGLVKAVYVVERPDSGLRLRRFDAAKASFVDSDWPQDLSPVRAILEASSAEAVALPVPLPFGADLSLPPVVAEAPALLSTVMDVFVSEKPVASAGALLKMGRLQEMFVQHGSRSAVEVIQLDREVLRQQVVEGAARARLGNESPFEWAVVANGSSSSASVIAGSQIVATLESKAAADAAAPLLRLRMDELDQSFLRGLLPGVAATVVSDSGRVRAIGAGSSAASGPSSARADSSGGGPAAGTHVNGAVSVSSGTVTSSARSSVRLVVQMGRPGTSAGGATSGNVRPPWELRLRHRAGSIDAAVQTQKARNTALSASILGVLGLSAGLVFYSARRLRAVASQQVEFVAAVSHELRTPLAVIRSAADNLADGVVKEDAQARRYGTLIRGEALRLADMVEHVLEFAGADSPARATRAAVPVVRAVQGALDSLASLIAERRATVAFDAPTDAESILVNGDLSHLTRAVSNLVVNALKYGGDSPDVQVSLRREGSSVAIGVSDRGEGLAESEVDRLFEPFFRGRRALETQTPGSGLGLALVRRIARSHGGDVMARPREGGGAIFTLKLPIA